MLHLSDPEKDDQDVRTLTVTKSNYGRSGERVTLRWGGLTSRPPSPARLRLIVLPRIVMSTSCFCGCSTASLPRAARSDRPPGAAAHRPRCPTSPTREASRLKRSAPQCFAC